MRRMLHYLLALSIAGAVAGGCQTAAPPTAPPLPAMAAIPPAPAAPALADTTPPGAVFVRAVDGDTVVMRYPDGVLLHVRLARIDCPERGQPGAAEATAATVAWCRAAERLRLDYHTHDRWNRPVCDLYRDADPVSLSAYLLAAGLAVPWP